MSPRFEIREVSVLVTEHFRVLACLDLKQPRPIFTRDCKELDAKRGDLLLFIDNNNIIGKSQLEVNGILFSKSNVGKVVKFIIIKQELSTHQNLDLYLKKVSVLSTDFSAKNYNKNARYISVT